MSDIWGVVNIMLILRGYFKKSKIKFQIVKDYPNKYIVCIWKNRRVIRRQIYKHTYRIHNYYDRI